MSSTYISVELRQRVYERANGCCEYCLIPESLSLVSFAIDHIIAEKHGGLTQADNLALSCPVCNRYKGSDIASLDPNTGELAAFFNPRRDCWSDHFSLSGAMLSPISIQGRVTAKILKLNQADRIEERRLLATAGLLKPIVYE